MPRYIDADYADKLAKDLFKGEIGITFYQAVHAMLESIKPVDAVPVVHCTECAFCDRVPCPARDPETGKTRNCVKYCGIGERKEEQK